MHLHLSIPSTPGVGQVGLSLTLLPIPRYMAVGNLHPKAGDHTARIARFALEALSESSTLAVHHDRPELGCIQMRAGFHTGPVVASVIGDLNPRCESALRASRTFLLHFWVVYAFVSGYWIGYASTGCQRTVSITGFCEH